MLGFIPSATGYKYKHVKKIPIFPKRIMHRSVECYNFPPEKFVKYWYVFNVEQSTQASKTTRHQHLSTLSLKRKTTYCEYKWGRFSENSTNYPTRISPFHLELMESSRSDCHILFLIGSIHWTRCSRLTPWLLLRRRCNRAWMARYLSCYINPALQFIHCLYYCKLVKWQTT